MPTDMVSAIRAFNLIIPIDFLNRGATFRAFVDIMFLFPFREFFFGLHSGLVCFATDAIVIVYLAVDAYDVQTRMAKQFVPLSSETVNERAVRRGTVPERLRIATYVLGE